MAGPLRDLLRGRVVQGRGRVVEQAPAVLVQQAGGDGRRAVDAVEPAPVAAQRGVGERRRGARRGERERVDVHPAGVGGVVQASTTELSPLARVTGRSTSPRSPSRRSRQRDWLVPSTEIVRTLPAVGVAQVQRVTAVGRDVRDADRVLGARVLQAGDEAAAGEATVVGGEVRAARERAVLRLARGAEDARRADRRRGRRIGAARGRQREAVDVDVARVARAPRQHQRVLAGGEREIAELRRRPGVPVRGRRQRERGGRAAVDRRAQRPRRCSGCRRRCCWRSGPAGRRCRRRARRACR